MHPQTSTLELERVLNSDQRAQVAAFLSELDRGSATDTSIPRGEDVASPSLDPTPSRDSNGRLLVLSSRPHMAEAVATYVARHVNRELFTVELSSVLSKFIAETEKRMEEVLDVAGEDRCVVFIDHADALFSADTDPEKKFADQEIGYVLHHINSYNGIVIIGMDGDTTIHPALRERFRFVLHA